jgi:DNA polymerase-3 subunit epsilon
VAKSQQSFLAIDFETASYSSDSACAIGLVRVNGTEIASQKHFLIKPPSRSFAFTHIHGITWKQVEREPTFGELWPELVPFFEDIDFVVAHNVGFDRKVLASCCELYDIALPTYKYQCTVQLARKELGIFPTNLPAVCNRLKIELKHHDAMSDALACAKIAMAVFAKNPVAPPTLRIRKVSPPEPRLEL